VDTVKTDIKRAVCSLPFLVSVAIMILIIMFGAGKDMIFPKAENIKYGLFPFYYMEIAFKALRSDIVLIVVPIICTLPYTAAFLDEYTSGYIKIYIMKTHKEDYVRGKVLATAISGGLTMAVSVCIVTIIAALIYRPMEVASEEAVSPILNLIIKTTVLFLSGCLWSSVGMLLANVSLSKYMAYASPFVIYYVLVILAERYFRSVYVINPKEWLVQENFWPGGDWGVMLLLILLTVPVMLISGNVIRRKIEG
jgi:hypothetical protein